MLTMIETMGDFYILSLFLYLYKQQKDSKAANQSESKQCFQFIKVKSRIKVLFKYSARVVFLLHL